MPDSAVTGQPNAAADALNQQKTTMRRLTTMLTNQIEDYLVNQTQFDIEDLEDFVVDLDSKQNVLERLNIEFAQVGATPAQLDADMIKYDEYRVKILKAKRRVERAINGLNQGSATNVGTAPTVALNAATATVPMAPPQQLSIRVPQLEPMTFSGETSEWTDFWSRFKICIDDAPQMRPAEKLVYLKQYVKGTALSSIKNLPLLDANYEKAKTLLKNRFGRDDNIVSIHMANIFELSPVTKANDIVGLRKFYDSCEVEVGALKSLGEDFNSYGTILCPVILKKLPMEITLEFSRKREDDRSWNVEELLTFVGTEVLTRERASVYSRSTSEGSDTAKSEQTSHGKFRFSQYNARGKGPPQSSAANFNVATERFTNAQQRCIFCRRSNHKAESCYCVGATKKREIIQTKGLCYICLKSSHYARDCRAKPVCEICEKRHLTVLCWKGERKEGGEEKTENNEGVPHTQEKNGVSINLAPTTPSNTVYIQTTRVQIKGTEGSMTLRCLLDNGSQRTFIRRDLSQQLGLEMDGEENILVHAFMQENPTIISCKRVKVTLRSVHDNQSLTVKALEIPEINGIQLESPNGEIRRHIEQLGLVLGDSPSTDEPNTKLELGVLLGADYYWNAVSLTDTIRLEGALVAQKSIFGWLIQGPSSQPGSHLAVQCAAITVNKVTTQEIETIGDDLRKFWDLESIGINEAKESQLEENRKTEVEKTFEERIATVDGRYEVALPWKENRENLPNNYSMSVRRLSSLLRRLESDEKLFKEYDDIIRDYAQKGIIEKVTQEREVNEAFYLPHHPVIREDKTTTKVRIVFDGSAKTKNGSSLNDCLEAGPNINPDLYDVLINFRKHKIAVTADIQQAFLQIAINPDERDFVRFLWIKQPISVKPIEIEEWRFTRVLFGVTSSPYLLAATIRYHVKKYMDIYPETCQKLIGDMFVDDLTSGAEDEFSAMKLVNQAKEVMAEANMTLRKFQSSSPFVRKQLQEIGESSQETVFPSPVNKVLGLAWNPESDQFSFKTEDLEQVANSLPMTKRSVLKMAARIFDPLGFLTPFTITVKILLQSLWLSGKDWDDALPEELEKSWTEWISQIPTLADIRIERDYFGSTENDKRQGVIHIFCDSSKAAYGAVAYYRFHTNVGEVQTSFITARARVAPIKKMTIPKLELLACLIGARLGTRLANIFKSSTNKMVFWTDSSTAYHWIKRSARDKREFVANRVSEIQEKTEPHTWNYCPGSSNPADHLSRGLSSEELKTKDIWWKGPPWLRLAEDKFPKLEPNLVANVIADEPIEPEDTPNNCLRSALIDMKPEAILALNKYSSLEKVIRITAWIKRIFYNKRNPQDKATGPLSARELEEAELYWNQTVQWESFSSELKEIAKTGRSRNSKIAEVDPVLDKNGLMRLGGRLQRSSFSYATKHPIILPYKHRYSELQMQRAHEQVKHSGAPATLVQVRDTYWILKGRQLAKNCVSRCIFCRKWNAKPSIPKTAPLPTDRITASRPFEIVGIDFAGPLFLKDGSGKKKCYVTLITCATTRAIHLELITTLTTRYFLMAFSNFISRRGIPRKIYSDNAKTFKRAEKELNALWRSTRSDEAKEYFGKMRIEWKYIVERGPWWGGFWERLVRSVKVSMRKIMGKAFLSYEELYSVIAQAEAVINSRPLTYTYSAPNDPSPLTPAHFLIGEKFTALPTGRISEELPQLNRASAGQRLTYQQNVLTRYWNRWKKEYILELQSAHKLASRESVNPIMKDDVVLLNDADTPRHKWKLARVQEVYKGRDGQIRSCDIKLTNGNIVKRPVNLLAPLELK